MKTLGPKNPTTKNLLVEVDSGDINVEGYTTTRGVYIADPAASTLADGEDGYILLNDQRMQVTEDRTFDPVSDANKNIPVWSPHDNYSFEDLSGTTAIDGTFNKYVSMEGFSYFSLQYIPTVTDGYQELTVHVSNEDVADITLATYTDVTQTFFGSANFSAEEYIEKDTVCSFKYMKVVVLVSGSIGTETWDLFLTKKSA